MPIADSEMVPQNARELIALHFVLNVIKWTDQLSLAMIKRVMTERIPGFDSWVPSASNQIYLQIRAQTKAEISIFKNFLRAALNQIKWDHLASLEHQKVKELYDEICVLVSEEELAVNPKFLQDKMDTFLTKAREEIELRMEELINTPPFTSSNPSALAQIYLHKIKTLSEKIQDTEDLMEDILIKLFLIKGKSINAFKAARYGVHKTLKEIVALNPSVLSSVDSEGCTPLLVSIKSGQLRAAKILLRAGSLLSTTDSQKRTALHLAVLHTSVPCFHWLLGQGIVDNLDLNAKDRHKRTPLIYATLGKRIHMTEELLRKGAMISTSNTDIESPLQIASSNYSGKCDEQELKLLELLIRAHQAMSQPTLDRYGYSPFYYSVRAALKAGSFQNVLLFLAEEFPVSNEEWQVCLRVVAEKQKEGNQLATALLQILKNQEEEREAPIESSRTPDILKMLYRLSNSQEIF